MIFEKVGFSIALGDFWETTKKWVRDFVFEDYGQTVRPTKNLRVQPRKIFQRANFLFKSTFPVFSRLGVKIRKKPLFKIC